MNTISKRISAIVFLALTVSFFLSLFFQYTSYKHELNLISENSLSLTEKSFDDVLKSETQKLSLALDFLLTDEKAQGYFLKNDTNKLYKHSIPIFKHIKEKYSITHFYYIMPEPDKTCFLRVHNRKKNGDLITRFTYKSALNTREIGTGLELGKTAFALRVVKPYYKDGDIVGYLEVGQEIDHFFDLINSTTGDNFLVAVNKKFLNEAKWKSARKSNNELAKWDEFEKNIVISKTNDDINLDNVNLHEIPEESSVISENYSANGKKYILGQFPLIDAGKRNVGTIYYTHDITDLYKELVTNVVLMSVVFLLLSLLFAAFTMIFIRKTITNPIERAVDSMDKIAERQIGFAISEKRDDEIGKLFVSINKINNNFREIVTNIKNTASAVLGASSQLNSTSMELSERANEQAATTEEVGTSMEEILATIQANTKSAENTEHITNKSAFEIKESNKAFLETIKSVTDISKKTDLITEIATQTNILSLNASIEAARAGESGKGFAVVAQEVRKLADRSRHVSNQISELSEKGNDISKVAETKLKGLIPEVIKSAEFVNNIVVASHEQQRSVEHINTSVQQLTEITNRNSASAEEMSSAAEELASQAQRLNELISIFKVGDLESETEQKVDPIKPDEYIEQKVVEQEGIDINLVDNKYATDEKFEEY